MSIWLTVILLMGEPGASATGVLFFLSGIGTPVADAPGSPPVVGRPVDFSGAVGGPFVVQWIATPTELTAEEPLTLTLRITGPGNLADISRPALSKLDAFKSFAVEEIGDRYLPGEPPRREFRYRVRPRSAEVKEIPRLKFVYFNPRIVPASRGFQTTYADAAPLTVKPRTVQTSRDTPVDVPAWMLEPPASDELFGPPRYTWQIWLDRLLEKLGFEPDESQNAVWFMIGTAVLMPPVVCWLLLRVWRRINPDAARLAAGRRSRAAAVALREIKRPGNDPAGTIANALTRYLRDRAGLPKIASTSAEIKNGLSELDCPAELIETTTALLQRCDAARFAHAVTEDANLTNDALSLILEWEAAAWAASGC